MDYFSSFTSLSLGIITSLHPCLALLNLSAITIISGPVHKSAKMIMGGIVFITGRVIVYICIGLLLLGGTTFSPQIAQLVRYYGNALMGPLFIIIGMIISGMFGSSKSAKPIIQLKSQTEMFRYMSLFILGAIHAVSFCPVSAGLFFGILIPLSLANNSVIMNMTLYGVGTGFPLIIFIILVAGSKQMISRFSERLKFFEFWIKNISGALLVMVGIYLTLHRVFNLF